MADAQVPPRETESRRRGEIGVDAPILRSPEGDVDVEVAGERTRRDARCRRQHLRQPACVELVQLGRQRGDRGRTGGEPAATGDPSIPGRDEERIESHVAVSNAQCQAHAVEHGIAHAGTRGVQVQPSPPSPWGAAAGAAELASQNDVCPHQTVRGHHRYQLVQ